MRHSRNQGPSEHTLGITDAVEVVQRYLRVLERAVYYGQSPVPVMFSRISREETFARWRYVGVSDIRHHCCRAVRVMSDDACAQFIRGAFETESYVWPLCPLEMNALWQKDI